jgi:hypothetical protein
MTSQKGARPEPALAACGPRDVRDGATNSQTLATRPPEWQQRRGNCTRLIAKRTEAIAGRRHVYLYDVEFDGAIIVNNSPDPECDLAPDAPDRDKTAPLVKIGGPS